MFMINSKGWQTRAITEPESERVVRGPREGFTESIIMNISLIRRKIRTPDLKIKFKEIGERTHTKTCICYLEGIAANNILRELGKRLDEIEPEKQSNFSGCLKNSSIILWTITFYF